MEKRNIANVAWAMAEKLAQLGLAMMLTALIVRYFGVQLFGAYQFSLSVFFIITTLTWICPGEMFYARLDENGNLSETVISTSICYRLIISLTVFLGTALYVHLRISDHYQTAFILILSITILYSEPLGIYRFLIESQGHYHYTARLRMVSATVKVLLVYLLIKAQVAPLLLLSPIVAEAIINCAGCVWLYRKKMGHLSFSIRIFDKYLAFQFLQEGIKYWIGLLGMNLFLRVDRFYLESHLTKIDYGHYSAAMSMIDQFTSIATMLIATLAPIIVYRSAKDKVVARIAQLAGSMFAMALLGTTILLTLSPLLIKLLFGQHFENSIEVFNFAILFSPLVYLDAVLTTLLIRQRAAKLFAIKWLAALSVSYSINYYGFPHNGWKAGILGYGSGWAISLIFSVAYFAYFYKKQIRHVTEATS